MARVDQVGDGIYRISTTVAHGDGAFQFNQFLIDDERPALIHTGLFPMYHRTSYRWCSQEFVKKKPEDSL
jgi:hypothetical protein